MKILVLQDWLRSGGTERQSVFLANAFAAAGHAVSLLTFRPGGRLASTVSPTVQLASLQPFDCGADWFAPGLTGRVHANEPDVILCMGRMANCYAGSLQRALPRTAVIGTMRTGKSLPWLFRRSLKLVRHVVANSEEAKDFLANQHGVPEGRLSVIYNSLVFSSDQSGNAEASAALRKQYGADTATSVLLCVAMFRPEKNQRELIEIVAGLPADARVQLWLAGDGPARALCERRAVALNVGDRVRFVGFHRDPTALYGAADFAVHASWSESLSNFLIEAQANGLPAIAYQAQGIRECFAPAETGWAIARDDRDAFRARILVLVAESPETRRARSAAARAYARTTFDPRGQVAKYLELFEQIRFR